MELTHLQTVRLDALHERDPELSNTLQVLFEQVNRLEDTVKKLNKRVSWEEKTTASGIQLTAGPTTVSRFGTLMAACPVQIGPTEMTIAFCIQEEVTGKICVVSADACKFVSQD